MTVETLTTVLLRRRSWLEIAGWLLAAIGFLAFAWFLWEAIRRDGGAGYDVRSYLLAARNLLDGEPLYVPVPLNAADAYRYPPTFAVLWIPASALPELVATWSYRAGCVLCLRYLVGSWRAVGWALLFVPVWVELTALNVTFPIAAASRWALRGGPRGAALGAGLMPATAAVKWGTALTVPYLWVTRRAARRPLVIGLAIVVLVAGIHALLDPATWAAYFASLVQQAESPNADPRVGEQLLFIVPNTLWDFVLRLAIALALTGIAIWRRWDWLAFTAALLAVPTLWVARLAPLVAVPRLWWEERQAAEGPSHTSPADVCRCHRPYDRREGQKPRIGAGQRS